MGIYCLYEPSDKMGKPRQGCLNIWFNMHPTVEDESIDFIIYAFGGPNEAGRESIAFKYLTNQVI